MKEIPELYDAAKKSCHDFGLSWTDPRTGETYPPPDRSGNPGGLNFPYPTPAEINALPEGLRRYIHDLETRCDPAGDLQTIAAQREQIEGLLATVKEREAQLVEFAEAILVIGEDYSEDLRQSWCRLCGKTVSHRHPAAGAVLPEKIQHSDACRVKAAREFVERREK